MRALSHIVLIALGFAVLAAPVAAMEYSELKTVPAAPGGTLTVDASFHDVTVTAEPGSEVRIQVDLAVAGSGSKAEKRMARLKPTFEVDGDVDTSSGGIRSDFPGRFNEDRDHLRFEGGPDAVRIRVDTSSGRVTLIES